MIGHRYLDICKVWQPSNYMTLFQLYLICDFFITTPSTYYSRVCIRFFFWILDGKT
jgi:hypothetical protein